MAQDEVPLVDKIRSMMHIFEDKDLDTVMTMFTEDMRFTDPGLNNVVDLDREGYKKWMASFNECTENIKIDVKKAYLIPGNTAWIMEYRASFKYVKDCPYLPAKATGQDVVGYGMSISEVDDKFRTRVCREYCIYDWDGADKGVTQ